MSTALLQTLDTSYNIILMVTLSRCYSRFKENEADLKRLTILLKNQSVTHSRVWFQIFNLHQHLGANLKTRNFHKGSKKYPVWLCTKEKKKKQGTAHGTGRKLILNAYNAWPLLTPGAEPKDALPGILRQEAGEGCGSRCGSRGLSCSEECSLQRCSLGRHLQWCADCKCVCLTYMCL